MPHCANCGTKMSDGLCPNCEEETFIYVTQAEHLPPILSDEFMRKVEQQSAEIVRREKIK